MHLNYYTLKRLSIQLSEKLVDANLISCFSQEKDELILGFLLKDQSDFFIRATLQSDFTALSFPQNFARSRKNNVDLFQSLINQTVDNVHQYENERAFCLGFNKGSKLIFKMHGNRSNIILFKENTTNELFKKKLVNDLKIRSEELERPIHKSLQGYLDNPDYHAFYPTFGKVVKKHLADSKFSEKDHKEQWQMLEGIKVQLEQNPFYLILLNNQPHLSLIPFKEGTSLTQNPIDALNQFYQSYHRDFLFEREKRQSSGLITKRINQGKAYIVKTQKELNLLENTIQPNQIADIIMANLHAIKPNLALVKLFNFYSNEEIEIKLNKDLSPQKNAENYYRKSKNRKIELDKLFENLSNKESQMVELEMLLEELGQVESVKSLRQTAKDFLVNKDKKKADIILPYKSFTFQGYQIWVGKNAKANDELTLKFAYKEDLWLHAKDVAGSHVLIKHQSGKKTPVQVIERAAAYAAYYSKRKTDTLVPVLYTPAKYVRKKKGSAPGKVFVSQENVLLTPALGPQD
ncbi:MAG: putative ribosome quality control (RQC) complex YloA/Tae2 family protein [Roseivirga sp.]|jgi:predicted ribosome quality control (RQC) complex YloA/Tae2 family protein